MNMRHTTLATLLALALAASAALAQPGPNTAMLAIDRLASTDLTFDGHYEAWARVDGDLVSLGTFNVNEFGQLVDIDTDSAITDFDAGTDVSGATEILISVEPPDDADPASSGVYILRGDVSGGAADLRPPFADLDQLENDATAAFILATPSDDDVLPDNDEFGIWFLTRPDTEAGLMNLPDLGDDWHYEGWIVDVADLGNPRYYSTGTFTSGEGFDSDMAGPMGGGPMFPGQDFVDFQGGPVLALNSGNYAVMVTIEPELDAASDRPFMLTVFRDGIATDALDRNNDVANLVGQFPTGTAFLYTEVATQPATLGGVKAAFR